MPNVQSLIGAQGTTFNEAYVPFPLCCPSRATMLSGAVHAQPRGARQLPAESAAGTKFRPHESNDLPVWLQDDGYYNVHIGKYLNGYATGDGTPARPPGLGRVVRKGLRGRALLRLPADREDRGRRRLPASRSTATSRTTTRPMCFGDRARRLRPGQRGLEPARSGSTSGSTRRTGRSIPAPRDLFGTSGVAAAEAARLQREEHQRQAELAAEAGKQPARKKQIEGDRQRAAPAAGAADLGR